MMTARALVTEHNLGGLLKGLTEKGRLRVLDKVEDVAEDVDDGLRLVGRPAQAGSEARHQAEADVGHAGQPVERRVFRAEPGILQGKEQDGKQARKDEPVKRQQS